MYKSLLNYIFPRQCYVCSKFGDYLCADCQAFLSRSTQVCHVCREKSVAGLTHQACKPYTNLDQVLVCLNYSKLIEKIVTDFKYHNYFDIADFMAGYYIKLLEEYQISDTVFVPVPLHKRRLWERGFNQSELICKKLEDEKLGKGCNILVRKINTRHQVGLKRAQRLVNLEGAFTTNSNSKSKQIDQKSIFLVDDIMTTGATLKECAANLNPAGTQSVSAIVFARG